MIKQHLFNNLILKITSKYSHVSNFLSPSIFKFCLFKRPDIFRDRGGEQLRVCDGYGVIGDG